LIELTGAVGVGGMVGTGEFPDTYSESTSDTLSVKRAGFYCSPHLGISITPLKNWLFTFELFALLPFEEDNLSSNSNLWRFNFPNISLGLTYRTNR
jgi:hypothetical protein